MKMNLYKILTFILLVSLIMSGCSVGVKEPPVVSESPSDTTAVIPAPVLEDENKNEYSESNYKNESFLASGYISVYENMIYYSLIVPGEASGGNNTYKNELRRCSFDLLKDESIFSTESYPWYYHPRFVLNPDGHFISNEIDLSQSSPTSALYIFNVHDGSIEKNILSTSQSIYGDIVLYKDKIIYSIDNRGAESSTKIDIYDLRNNSVNTIFTGAVYDFGVIDNAIYFLPIQYDSENQPSPKQAIMRYDILSETTERVFTFDLSAQELGDGQYFLPKANYNGRNIIVQNSPTTFVYMNIDDINPQKISFADYKKLDYSQAVFIQSNDEDMYFCLYYYENVEEGYRFSEYFKVSQGTNKPVLLTGLTSDRGEYFAEGNMYYIEYDFNTNGKIKSEKVSS